MRLILCPLTLAAVLVGPALAADKLIPATATGAVGEHRGKPWLEPLTNCAGFHAWNGRNLKLAGDTKGAWDEAGKTADFMTAAANRVSQDRSVTYDQAFAGNQRPIKNVMTYLDMEMVPPDVTDWTQHCQEILAGYRKAFP
ncbi:MAG: hypothetical protein Q7T61_07615 [Caulobacter sp.]|nr:hypothetical protein [Caulobacter sp.]